MTFWVLQILSPNAAAPKFAPEKIELRYHTASPIGAAPARVARGSPELLWASDIPPRHRPLFHWVPLSRVGAAHHRPARPRTRRDDYRRTLPSQRQAPFVICPSQRNCRIRSRNGSLSWKVSRACGFVAEERTSRDLRSSFLAGTARPLAIRRSTPGSSSPANALGCRSFPPIPCGIQPQRCCSTSAEPTCVTSRPSLGTRVWQQRHVTLRSIPSGFARWSGTSGWARSSFLAHEPGSTQGRKAWGRLPARPRSSSLVRLCTSPPVH